MEDRINVSLAEMLWDLSYAEWLLGASITPIEGECYRLAYEGKELLIHEDERIALIGWRILYTHRKAFLELAR